MKKPSIPKINKQLTIKIAIVAVVLIGLVGLATAVGAHWHEQKHKDAVAAQVAVDAAHKKQAEYDHALGLIPQYKQAYDKQRINCEKGLAAYNALPLTTKKAIKPENVPTCGPAVLSFE